MLYGKEGIITLVEVQAALRTKELTKSKDLRADENSEGLSVSRRNGGGRGNHGKSGNKSKFKCFNCHKLSHFKKDCPENNGNSTQKLSLRVMRMRVLWWCHVGEMKKVMSLTLGFMPYRAVVIWREIKNSTTTLRGGGKNTHGQSDEWRLE
jgi:hypothetical protein